MPVEVKSVWYIIVDYGSGVFFCKRGEMASALLRSICIILLFIIYIYISFIINDKDFRRDRRFVPFWTNCGRFEPIQLLVILNGEASVRDPNIPMLFLW